MIREAVWLTENLGRSGFIKHITKTDEDPRLRIKSFAIINLRSVSTKL